jgi:hypothetical protein
LGFSFFHGLGCCHTKEYWLDKEEYQSILRSLIQGFALGCFIITQFAFDFCERQRKNQKFRESFDFKLLSWLVVRPSREKVVNKF